MFCAGDHAGAVDADEDASCWAEASDPMQTAKRRAAMPTFQRNEFIIFSISSERKWFLPVAPSDSSGFLELHCRMRSPDIHPSMPVDGQSLSALTVPRNLLKGGPKSHNALASARYVGGSLLVSTANQLPMDLGPKFDGRVS
jgi:hypothetical protein